MYILQIKIRSKLRHLPCKSETSIASSYLHKDVSLFTISVPVTEAMFKYPQRVTGPLQVQVCNAIWSFIV